MRRPLRLSPVDCIVLFQPARDWPPGACPWWWRFARRFMAPGFGHCLVLYYDPDGDAFCVIDPVFGGIQAQALSAATFTVQDIVRQVGPVSHWAVVRRNRHGNPLVVRGPLTCVSVTKAVLGLAGRSWTPYQLWRQIKALPGAVTSEISTPAADARRDPGHAGPDCRTA